MFRRFAVFFPSSAAQIKDAETLGLRQQMLTVKGSTGWQYETEILVSLDCIARIVPNDCGYPFIIMKDGTSWLSAIEYNFLAEELDGLKL